MMDPRAALAMGQGLSDEQLVEHVLAGDLRYFEVLMRRHNQRLFRAGRAILKNDDEAEDVMQEAYVRAYAHLASFAGRSSFATWLTRIAVHEALGRLRKRRGYVERRDDDLDPVDALPSDDRGPERRAGGEELRLVLEREIDALPEGFRAVLVLRLVEDMSVSETADCLEIPEETVKTRLHRARALLKRELSSELGADTKELFGFHLVRCDRIVVGALGRVASPQVAVSGF